MDYLSLELLEDGIAAVRFFDKQDRMNKLSPESMSEFDSALQDIEKDSALKGVVVISDKEDNFIVGADLKELAAVDRPGIALERIRSVHALFERMEKLPIPLLAAINGACLGGGLELALACHYRIATDHPKTVLGLPEVKLGLIPAAGGTQRLMRLTGVGRALPLMLEGRTMNPAQAKAFGVIDMVVYPYELLTTAKKCLPYLAKRTPRGKKYPRFRSLDWLLVHSAPARKFFFHIARTNVQEKTQGNYPAPLRLIECVEAGISGGMAAGSAAEEKAFDDLVLSPESKELRRLFFATTALKKNPLAPKAKDVKRLGVLGSGHMGSGIASVSAKAGIPVVLKDVSWSNLGAGLKKVWTYLEARAKRLRQNPVERDKSYSRIVPALDYSQYFASLDLVIEAVFEDLSVKHEVLGEFEKYSAPECIFATNTSAIPVRRIAQASARPGNVIGMHYFSPVPSMPLLEIVVTPETEEWVTATAIDLGRRQGKTAIVIKDGPGFYTSRILSTLIHEALALLHEGATIERVDRVMRKFGFPVGPLKLLDEVGLDVAAHASEELSSLLSERGFSPPDVLKSLLEAGYLGRKNGQGFYRYSLNWWEKAPHLPGARPPRPVNEKIYRFFGGRARKEVEDSSIQERLVLIMANEAVLCLQESILSSASDGDVGAVLGLGFPPFLGGPFRYLEKFGIGAARKRLDELASEVGKRFKPARLLVDMAERGEVFYRE